MDLHFQSVGHVRSVGRYKAGVLLLGNSLQISFYFRGECIYFGRIGSRDADCEDNSSLAERRAQLAIFPLGSRPLAIGHGYCLRSSLLSNYHQHAARVSRPLVHARRLSRHIYLCLVTHDLAEFLSGKDLACVVASKGVGSRKNKHKDRGARERSQFERMHVGSSIDRLGLICDERPRPLTRTTRQTARLGHWGASAGLAEWRREAKPSCREQGMPSGPLRWRTDHLRTLGACPGLHGL